jgi:hypothetical protein
MTRFRWHRMFTLKTDGSEDGSEDSDDRRSKLVRNDIVLSSDHWMPGVEAEKKRRLIVEKRSPPITSPHDMMPRMLSSPRRQIQRPNGHPRPALSSSSLGSDATENFVPASCTDIVYRKPTSSVGHAWMSPSRRKRPRIVWRFSASLIDKSRDGIPYLRTQEVENDSGDEEDDEDDDEDDGMGEIGL